MDLGLAGWRVLVTGGTNGIGAGAAAFLRGEGAEVVVAGRTGGRHVAGSVHPVVGVDLTTPEGPDTLRSEVIGVLGGLDGIVMSAGAASFGALQDTADGAFYRSFDLNAMASLRLLRTATPLLREQPGRVVVITALSASEPQAQKMTSNIAKAAQAVFAKTASRELAPDGILVNCVAPGRIRSGQVDERLSQSEQQAFADANIPLGRYGRPEEIAPMIGFLVSPRNTYITGATVMADGGMSHHAF
jgi:3-oxoacyl-[acyl-carrier protein] reductase